MRILFVAEPDDADYMSSMVLHGLRTVLGDRVVDYPRCSAAYKTSPRAGYGGGFTAFNVLDDLNVDRSDLESKLRNGYFDVLLHTGKMVYNVARYGDLTFGDIPFKGVRVIVDGGDQLTEDVRQPCFELPEKTLFFMRENKIGCNGLPISFSVPKEKILTVPSGPKKSVWAPYEPTMSYCYDTELSYYTMYAESCFALARRRGGWDCLRQYEIMMCVTIPFFLGIQKCPPPTMTSLPKKLLETIQEQYFYVFSNRPTKGYVPGDPSYRDLEKWYPDNRCMEGSFDLAKEDPKVLELCAFMREYSLENLTTEACANYILGKVRSLQ